MDDMNIIVVPFEVKSVKEASEDEEYHVVEGFASVYGNIDSYRDIVMPGAFTEDLAVNGNTRSIFWQHDSRQPIGQGIFTDMEKGLYVKCNLPKADTFVAGRVMPQVKAKSLGGFSIGYSVVEDEYDSTQNVRKLKKIKLWENSLVSLPANTEARILAAKNFIAANEIKHKTVPELKNLPIAESGTPWDGSKAVQDARKASGSEDDPSESYKEYFFYYDPENVDSYGGYKLPKAMVVDGKMSYVPKGLAAVVGALAGARGGINIPEADKEKIKKQLNVLYKKMGREEPFGKKGVCFLDQKTVKNMDSIDLERIWDDDVMLSNGAKKYIADAIAGQVADSDGGKGDSGLLEALKSLKQTL